MTCEQWNRLSVVRALVVIGALVALAPFAQEAKADEPGSDVTRSAGFEASKVSESDTFPLLIPQATSGEPVTVYNNFGEGRDGWDYNWGLGWTVAGVDVPAQFGVEQAMSFDSTEDGWVSDIWIAMWFVPLDRQEDVVTIRLARNPIGEPPAPEDVMEEWVLTEFESWSDWSPPHRLEGDGTSFLEAGESYWLWAIGGDTTWTGWCMNEDPRFTAPHTLRREGEDWLPIGNETASAFRVDVVLDGGCVRDPEWICDGDVDGDGQVNPVDSGLVQASFGSIDEGDLCQFDVDCDGQINPVDAGIVQSLFGTCEAPRAVCP